MAEDGPEDWAADAVNIHKAIASHLLHDSRVALLVDVRVYRLPVPPRTPFPYISYQRISERRIRHFKASVGLLASTIQIDCWSEDSNQAIELADAVRRSLDHLEHVDLGREPNAVAISAAYLENSIDDFTEPTDGMNLGVHRVIQTWDIWHAETLPELAV